MTDPQMQFPILAIRPHYREPCEQLDWFFNEDGFRCLDRPAIKRRAYVGALIVDAECRCWRIEDVTDLGPAGTGWRKFFNTILPLYRDVRYSFAEGPALSFDEVRDRACASIRGTPDDWRDDEAIAGEAGEPREEEEMLQERIDSVRRSTNMRDLIAALQAE